MQKIKEIKIKEIKSKTIFGEFDRNIRSQNIGYTFHLSFNYFSHANVWIHKSSLLQRLFIFTKKILKYYMKEK